MLYARELDDLYVELDKEKQIQYGQKYRVEPLTKEEKKIIRKKDFIIEKYLLTINKQLKKYIKENVLIILPSS